MTRNTHQRSSRTDRRYDIDEVTPGRFVVRNLRAAPLLKTEGDLEGRLFTLHSQRRDGLLARLRERGLRVRTLDDRIRTLPRLPHPPVPDAGAWQPLPPDERWSVFDPSHLDWIPATVEDRDGQAMVFVHAGQIVRRRRGRRAPAYALVEPGAGLRTIDETAALLLGYAQAAPATPVLQARRDGERIVLPLHPLPPPHHAFLRGLAETRRDGLAIEHRAWMLAQAVYASLGVRLELAGHDSS